MDFWNDKISGLDGELSRKDKIINKLLAEKEKLKQELHKFKDFLVQNYGTFS